MRLVWASEDGAGGALRPAAPTGGRHHPWHLPALRSEVEGGVAAEIESVYAPSEPHLPGWRVLGCVERLGEMPLWILERAEG